MTLLWVKSNEEKKVSDKINQHIKVINIANSISGIAKSAEGHLFLFLLLNNSNHKKKYNNHIQDLRIFFTAFSELALNKNQYVIRNNLKHSIVKLISHGHFILKSQQLRATHPGVIQSAEFNEQVSLYSESISNVNNSGLKLVSSSLQLLESDKQSIEEGDGLINNLLPIFVVLMTILIFIVFYQANRLRIRKHQVDALSELTFVDSLTGIANRRKFDDEYEKQWKTSSRTGKGFYLLMLDIDYFKGFNDYYGHTEGDRCLKKVAHHLRDMVSRQTDTVCRYGGEEFAIIMSESSSVQDVAEKCRQGIEGLKIENKNSKISDYLTLSIGAGEVLGCVSEEYTDGIQKIDVALYLAKRQGRNQVVNV